MSTELSPIIIFCFNRPHHLKKTLEALATNELAERSNVTVYSDGPRDDRDKNEVEACRQLLSNFVGFKSLRVVASEQNKGLAASVIAGVSAMLKVNSRLIVLEDDLITMPGFIRYMNHYLDRYENEPRVASILGYLKPIDEKVESPFFLRGTDCWGWGTWSRSWQLFNEDGQQLLDELSKDEQLQFKFEVDGTYPYMRQLKEQVRGEINSWAIRWGASVFLADKLSLYPPFSLVENIGLDGTGTHQDNSSKFGHIQKNVDTELLFKDPGDPKENSRLRQSIANWNKANAPSFWEKLRYNIKKRIG